MPKPAGALFDLDYIGSSLVLGLILRECHEDVCPVMAHRL
jgi:hypothetical protein